ncbi:MAG: TetR/AcrR family transcriptional regulator, partial [Candidatus Binatia bacterium]
MTTHPTEPGSAPRPTRERILDAAEQVFAEKGLGAAPVRDIAARVGLNP